MYAPPFPGDFGPRRVLSWLGLLAVGNALFAAGCALLLLGVADWVLAGDYALFNLRIAALGLAVFVAWPLLFLSVARMGDGVWATRSQRGPAALAAAFALAGALAGILALPLVFPEYAGGWFGWYEWQYILFLGYFVYVPVVFAPVLVGHAALAFIVARVCRDRSAWTRLFLGALLLVAVAVFSLGAEVITHMHGPAWGLVGLAIPGYVLISLGALRERRVQPTGVPWPGPAVPSPGPWP